MPTSKFGYFGPKTVGLPFGKKSILGRKTNILLKASNRISMSENVPLDTFWASQGTRDKEIAHKRWTQDKGKRENSSSGRYLHLKMIPKGIIRYAEMAKDIKE